MIIYLHVYVDLTDAGATSENQQQSAATAEGDDSAAGAQPQSLKCDELVNTIEAGMYLTDNLTQFFEFS